MKMNEEGSPRFTAGLIVRATKPGVDDLEAQIKQMSGIELIFVRRGAGKLYVVENGDAETSRMAK